MQQLPLSGLKVIELASVLAGPSVGMFLAELGAEVIKIEHFAKGGDVTRSWRGKGESSESISAYFSSVNWGKRSVGVDLSLPEGKDLLLRLGGSADIVLASFRPGAATRLGMDYPAFKAVNPAVIYADVNAYGRENTRPGYDAVIQAKAGFTYMNGTPDAGPVKMPVALMDVLAAHHLKEAILLALLHREKTGEGSYVSASLLKAGIASLVNQAANWLVAGKLPQRIGSDHPNIVPYGTNFLTLDGKWMVLAVGNDRQFSSLCEVLGMAALSEDPRFLTNPQRVVHKRELLEILSEAIKLVERRPLLEQLESAGVPAGAVSDLKDVFETEGPATEMLIRDRGITGVSGIAFEGVPHESDLPAPPELCGDTREVLQSWLNLEQEELNRLNEMGVIGGKDE